MFEQGVTLATVVFPSPAIREPIRGATRRDAAHAAVVIMLAAPARSLGRNPMRLNVVLTPPESLQYADNMMAMAATPCLAAP